MKDSEKERLSLMAFMQKLYEPFLQIRNKLVDQYLAVSDVRTILEISRRQLFYWDSKGLKISKKKTPKRSWRKFSIADLFGFSVVKELLNIGIDIENCKNIVEDLAKGLYGTPYLIYFFAVGEPVFLVGGFERQFRFIRRVHGNREFSQLYAQYHLPKPVILIPLHSLLRDTLKKTKKEDFYIETFRNVYPREDVSSQNRVVFWVDGEKIEFSKSDMASVEKLMAFDTQFKVSEEEV